MASTNTDQKPLAGDAPGQRRWRDAIPCHPACELLPAMTPGELRKLGEDINERGMVHPLVFWQPGPGPSLEKRMEHVADPQWPAEALLIDGRSRLDALELLGLPIFGEGKQLLLLKIVVYEADGVNPYDYAISVNIRRRHLSQEQTRDVIGKLLQRRPELSDRAIAKTIGAHNETVAAVRAKAVACDEIRHIPPTERITANGQKSRARKPENVAKLPAAATPAPAAARSPTQRRDHALADLVKQLNNDHPREQLRDLACIISDLASRWAEVPELDRREAAARILAGLGLVGAAGILEFSITQIRRALPAPRTIQ